MIYFYGLTSILFFFHWEFLFILAVFVQMLNSSIFFSFVRLNMIIFSILEYRESIQAKLTSIMFGILSKKD